MAELTAEGERRLAQVAEAHGVSPAAARVLLVALAAGQGTQAQFDHPELGGMGQWSRGGMIMIGDMFNSALKARVQALCADLSALLGSASPFVRPASAARGNWWPAELGDAASTGSQNDMRYAYFPLARRLAIDRAGEITVHDTGDHRFAGFSQQQGGGQSLSFTSQDGTVRVADLPLIGPTEVPDAPIPDVFATLEQLAELHRKGVLSRDEFVAKKTELLARL